MKKLIMTMIMVIGTLGFIACSDDNDEDRLSCDQLEQIAIDAELAYDADPNNNELCQAYRAALQDIVDEECPIKEEAATALDSFNCDDF